MTQPRFAALITNALSTGSASAPPPPSPEARAAAIAALARAIEARAKRQRVRRAFAVAGAAAIVLAALGVAHMIERASVTPSTPNRASSPSPMNAGPNAGAGQMNAGQMSASRMNVGAANANASSGASVLSVVVHPSGEGARVVGGTPWVGGGEALSPGAQVSSLPHGSAMLAFATGTAVRLEEGGELTLIEQGPSQVLALGAGALRADVAKLKDGERFVVRTADAEVEVHGTSFRVATAAPDPSCGAGTITRVAVYEGVVTVRHAGAVDRVPAGDVWPVACASAAPLAAPQRAAALVPPAAPLDAPRAAPLAGVGADARDASRLPPASGSDLARQNDMFADAEAAKRRGDAVDAVARFDAFIAAYPASDLAENAAAEKMRLLQSVDRTRAAVAARAYIARYPTGFARADAEAIVAGAP